MHSALLVHVGVATTDLDRSMRFWRDLLGFTVVDARSKLFVLSDGAHNITVFEASENKSSKLRGESVGLHIGVRVDDLASTLQGCLDLGLEITCDDIDNCHPFDPNNPPIESFKVLDPDGIVVDVTASKSQWLGVTI
jgi:catechol 2,3-dioxygenase-like lactoylglutathione lyase family enzyme